MKIAQFTMVTDQGKQNFIDVLTKVVDDLQKEYPKVEVDYRFSNSVSNALVTAYKED